MDVPVCIHMCLDFVQRYKNKNKNKNNKNKMLSEADTEVADEDAF
jgi:hypothetical protein